MGIDVTWEDENGSVLETLIDSSSDIVQLLQQGSAASSQCLRFIDEFGDTTFNRLQVPKLIEELEAISDKKLTETGRQFESRFIENVCEVHRQHTHLFEIQWRLGNCHEFNQGAGDPPDRIIAGRLHF